MPPMRKVAYPLLLLVTVMVAAVRGDEADEKGKNFWMQKKLEYAQNILSGLATEDFEAIGKNARTMKTLGVLEKWVHAKSDAYRTQLKIFEYANDELIRQADEKSVDGCGVAYMQLTLSCINCHRVVRDFDRPADKPQKARKN